MRAVGAEAGATEASMSEVGPRGKPGGRLPLMVLWSAEAAASPEGARIKRELQGEMAARSTANRSERSGLTAEPVRFE